MKLVYKKLGLIGLNTKEPLQTATTFIIYNKSTDSRLQIILCKLEIFCFPFIKRLLVISCTFIIISTLSFSLSLFLSCMLCLMNEVKREEYYGIIKKSLRISLINKVHLARFSSGTDIHNTSINIAAR